MPTELRKKSRDRITAQSSSALTAGQYPGDGSYSLTTNCLTINNAYSAGTENGLGASLVVLELDLTNVAKPTADASAKIYSRGRKAGGSWTKWKYSHTVPDTLIATTVDLYDAALFELMYDEVQLAVAAVGYDFDCTLYATPTLMEGVTV